MDSNLYSFNLQPHLYDAEGNPKPPGLICHHCSACFGGNSHDHSDTSSEPDIRDGDTSSFSDDWISFPGSINGKSAKPLIDTGGGANLIKENGWTRMESHMNLIQTKGNNFSMRMEKCPRSWM